MGGCSRQVAGSRFSGGEIEEALKNRRLLAMEIEIGRASGSRCGYCDAGQRLAAGEALSQREICDVILQGRDLGTRWIRLVGEEPAVDLNLPELIHFIRSRALGVEVFTNGSTITAEFAKRLLEERVGVVLMVNTVEDSIQDALNGKIGRFEPVQRAFRNLKQAGYPSAAAALGVSAVIGRQGIQEIATIWRWLRDQNIDPYFEIIVPYGEAKEGEGLYGDPSRLRELFAEIAEIDRERYGGSWEPQPPLLGRTCMGHGFSCRICLGGDVLPCIGLNIAIGNIREQKLRDIISDSEVLEDLRDHIQTIKGPCRSCERAERCYGCRGTAYQLTGDYLASDPLCWRNADRQGEIARLPFPADQIIPQKPPMRVVDAVVEQGERSGEISAVVSNKMPFVEDDGAMDGVAYLEMMAQATAAMDGFKRLGRAAAAIGGYLVGARKVEILEEARVGDRLRILLHKTARFGKFGTLKATVLRDGALLAQGEITVWQDASGSGEAASLSEGSRSSISEREGCR